MIKSCHTDTVLTCIPTQPLALLMRLTNKQQTSYKFTRKTIRIIETIIITFAGTLDFMLALI